MGTNGIDSMLIACDAAVKVSPASLSGPEREKPIKLKLSSWPIQSILLSKQARFRGFIGQPTVR
jgi:hypothetical protein